MVVGQSDCDLVESNFQEHRSNYGLLRQYLKDYSQDPILCSVGRAHGDCSDADRSGFCHCQAGMDQQLWNHSHIDCLAVGNSLRWSRQDEWEGQSSWSPQVCAFHTELCHLLCQRKGFNIETSGSSVSEEGQEASKPGLLCIEAAFLNVHVQILR